MQQFLWPTLFCVCSMALGVHCADPQEFVPLTGRVTGHVYCADTNAPARFATVSIFPDKAGLTDNGLWSTSVLADTSGAFAIEHLRDGFYYVVAELPGYLSQISEFTEEQLSRPKDAIFARMDQAVTKVHVQQGTSAEVEIRLVRGAAISGTIRYSDGSPAIGVTLQLLRQDKDSKWSTDAPGNAQNLLTSKTDDIGHFRISGLVAGNVVLKCTLKQGRLGWPGEGSTLRERFVEDLLSDQLTLDVFSGGVFRLSDAKPIKLTYGVEFNDADIIIPLDRIFQVSGVVSSLSDDHLLNDGGVTLSYSDTGAQLAEVPIRPDGSFYFPFVPKGDYTLSAGGSDVIWLDYSSRRYLQAYVASTQPLAVDHDVNGVVVQLQPKPPQQPAQQSPAQ